MDANNKIDGLSSSSSEPPSKRSFVHVTPASPEPVESPIVSQLSKILDEKLSRLEGRLSKLDNIEQFLNDLSTNVRGIESAQKSSVAKQAILEECVSSLQSENALLKAKMNLLETNSKKDNLLFHNVPESKKEDCAGVILNLVNSASLDMDMYLDKRSVIRAYRIGRFNQKNTRSIIVVFHHHHDRLTVLKSASAIRDHCGYNLAITEDFPAEIQAHRRTMLPIFHAAKKLYGSSKRVSLHGDVLHIGDQKYTYEELDNLPLELSPHSVSTISNDHTVAFFSKNSKLSNHFSSNFHVDNTSYNCVEQYVVHQQAVVFKDEKASEQVMRMSDPGQMRNLSKSIPSDKERSKADIQMWMETCPSVMLTGLYGKFSQDPDLKEILLATGEKTIIEASEDKFWGAGVRLKAVDVFDKDSWSGKNMLGQALMETRAKLVG
jgi:ribA/ribD-fused uncharacterized protein